MNDDQSQLVPSKSVIYLGFIIDSVLMMLNLPKEKQDHIVALRKRKLQRTKPAKIRDAAQVIGLLVSSFPAVDYGKFYRQLEKA